MARIGFMASEEMSFENVDGHADKDLYKWLNGRATATSLIDPGADLWCGDKTHTAVIPIILAQKQNPCTQSARSLRVRCKGKNLLHFLTPHRTVCVCVCGGGVTNNCMVHKQHHLNG